MSADRLGRLIQTRGVCLAAGVADPDEVAEITTPRTRPHRIVPQARGDQLAAYVESANSVHLALTHVSYGADLVVTPGEDDPDTYLFPICLAGAARVVYGNDALPITGSGTAMIAPYCPFRSEIRADFDQVILTVQRARIEALHGQLLGSGESCPIELPLAPFELHPAMLPLLESVAAMAGDQSATFENVQARLDDVVIESVLLSMPTVRAALPRQGSAVRSQQVRDAMSYMERHLPEPLTVVEVADHVGVTPRALQLAFRRDLDQTPMGWLRGHRLERARELLESVSPCSPMSVTEAARSTGFHHLGDFSTGFKARFGESPSAVLRSAQARRGRTPIASPTTSSTND